MGRGWRAAVRAAIWLVGAWISLFPVMLAAHIRPTLHLWHMAEAANDANVFRDFFFVVIVITVASFANLLYNLTKVGNRGLPDWGVALTLIVSLYYIYVLAYGMSRFTELVAASNGPIPAGDLSDDLSFMAVTIAITLAAELGITLTEVT